MANFHMYVTLNNGIACIALIIGDGIRGLGYDVKIIRCCPDYDTDYDSSESCTYRRVACPIDGLDLGVNWYVCTLNGRH